MARKRRVSFGARLRHSNNMQINPGTGQVVKRWGFRFLLVGAVFILAHIIWAFTSSTWQGVEPYRFVVASKEGDLLEEVVLYQYIPLENSLVSYRIPVDAYVHVAQGYGRYQLSALAKLSQLENKGSELITQTLANDFAYQVAATYIVENAAKDKPDRVLLGQLIPAFGRGSEANGYDLLRVWWLVRNVPQARVREVDLDALNVYVQFTDVDGVEKREISQLLLDDLILRTAPPANDLFFQVQVVVLNSTGIAGKAAQMGRMINHEGFDLIRVDDLPDPLEVNELWFKSEELMKSPPGIRLMQIVKPTATRIIPLDEYRSDVVVKLGDGGE